MSADSPAVTAALPDRVERALAEFVAGAREALGDTLGSIVLFGSAAENRLRATSDVNLVVVLDAIDRPRLDRCRPVLERGHAAVRIEVMWLLASELPDAAEAFAVKFNDIARRHRVLFGNDPFAALEVSRQASIQRLRQGLMNQVLRLRASYVAEGSREERLALRVAEAAGPLRVSAAELLELEGAGRVSPKDALVRVAQGWLDPARDAVLCAMSEARETRQVEPGRAADVLAGVIELARYLHRRAAAIV